MTKIISIPMWLLSAFLLLPSLMGGAGVGRGADTASPAPSVQPASATPPKATGSEHQGGRRQNASKRETADAARDAGRAVAENENADRERKAPAAQTAPAAAEPVKKPKPPTVKKPAPAAPESVKKPAPAAPESVKKPAPAAPTDTPTKYVGTYRIESWQSFEKQKLFHFFYLESGGEFLLGAEWPGRETSKAVGSWRILGKHLSLNGSIDVSTNKGHWRVPFRRTYRISLSTHGIHLKPLPEKNRYGLLGWPNGYYFFRTRFSPNLPSVKLLPR